MPTTLVGICRLAQIYYILTISLDSNKEEDLVQVIFPITIGTVPFRIPNSNKIPHIKYGNKNYPINITTANFLFSVCN